jgi:hypothetical protein
MMRSKILSTLLAGALATLGLACSKSQSQPPPAQPSTYGKAASPSGVDTTGQAPAQTPPETPTENTPANPEYPTPSNENTPPKQDITNPGGMTPPQPPQPPPPRPPQ